MDDAQADGAWWPIESQQDDYPGSGEFKNAYFLGFFAGITIESNDVTLDLNGHEIKQNTKLKNQKSCTKYE